MTDRKKKTAIGHFIDTLNNEDIEFKEESVDTTHEDLKVVIKKPKIRPSVLTDLDKDFEFELPSGKNVKLTPMLLDVRDCKIWNKNTRIQDFLTEANTQDLKDKIKVQGQLVPVLARPIDDPNYKYEIIYGSRRFFVCKSLGLKIKALVGTIDDLDSIYFMDAENAEREKPSAYEVGMSYKSWLRDGLFKNQTDIASHFGVTREWINRVIRISALPIEIVSCFKAPSELQPTKATRLISFYESLDNKEQDKVLALAKSLKGKDLESSDIINRIYSVKSEQGRTNNSSFESANRFIQDSRNRKVCKITTRSNGKVNIVFEKEMKQADISAILERLEKTILELL